MDELFQQVEATLAKVRPFLKRDGGDIELVGVKDGIAYIKLTGACDGCSYAMEDIAQGIDIIITEEVPGIVAVDGSFQDIPEDVMNAYLERKKEKAN